VSPKATAASKSARRITSHPDPIPLLSDSIRRGELVAVIGTGASLAFTDGTVPALSWKGLIEDGFAYCVQKGRISDGQAKNWKRQLNSPDIDDLLAAAEYVARKLDAPRGDLYARWLESVFAHPRPTNAAMEGAIRGLHEAGIPLCTLNYDTLIENTTGRSSINLHETSRVTAWMRHELPDILHLHGTWNHPESCILGIRDYQTTLGNEVRDLIQRSLASFRRLLFIGCSGTFADPNFSALIGWLREMLRTASPQHYALVTDAEVAARHADPAWQGFVEPIGFGSQGDLATFISDHFAGPATVATGRGGASAKAAAESQEHERLLRDYRAFLLRDCGQMSIEGVRADMNTAQRRFDLERLFVPLNVLPTPPDIPETDPTREETLRRWHDEHLKPHAFGEIFTRCPRLALLALPGGGKTLLLKRLAVAYADPVRREASHDRLPELELTPVLIRCREWREHIHRPILSLLRKLPDITGHASLDGIAEALLPLFRAGKVLLLVDGLDEIHDDGARTTFVEHLEQFLDEYELTRLVVTSREAGFSLVAPVLSRFCERWRVAPLDPDTITALCVHWHHLMSGESHETEVEARAVAEHLLRNKSLHRLAETPLLLTMLLVVKKGAGRLPPDRVSLYGRAVEVLLDTWNIKGHARLDPKEAVPQLAYVAFELMRVGRQTATESELLRLLAEARENVPQIRRYATDSPHAFLKRVELRSSLVIEAGYQVEGNSTVPFYQFRHLTFQEYLAGVAVVDGTYRDYQTTDTVLTPLKAFLTAQEWKEVVPMAAVLAKKQAEPLIGALVEQGAKLRKAAEVDRRLLGSNPSALPSPIARLFQCFVEEAEAAPETLTAALQLIAVFARGCTSSEDWLAFCRGPYGEELLHQALLVFQSQAWDDGNWLLNTCSRIAFMRHSWSNGNVTDELIRIIDDEDPQESLRGLLLTLGVMAPKDESLEKILPLQAIIEQQFFGSDYGRSAAAIWAWGLMRRQRNLGRPPISVMDRLLQLWLTQDREEDIERAAFALGTCFGHARDAWTPVLTEAEVELVRSRAKLEYSEAAAVLVAFHARSVWTDRALATRIEHMNRRSEGASSILRELNKEIRKSQKRKKS